MANEVVKLDLSKVPAFVRDRQGMSDVSKALMGGGGFSGRRLSIKGGVFRLLVNGKEVSSIDERYLDVIIANAAPKVSRTFYGEKYDGESETASPPKCWSADGEKPAADATEPQASNCASCPMNVKGSGDGDTKACRYSQRLALLLANDPEGDVLQFTVPAQSLFGKEEGDNRPLQSYVRFLAVNNIGVDEVVTRMKFDTKASHPKLFFKAERWLTDAEFGTTKEKAQSPEAKQAITMTVTQVDKAAPPALPGARPSAPAEEEPAPKAEAKASRKAKSAKVEEAAEPTVRTETKPAPAAAGKRDVNDLVAAWDSDD